MIKSQKRIVRWAMIGGLAMGTTFALGSCTISDEGLLEGFADIPGLADLHQGLISDMAEFFDSLDLGPYGPRGGQ
jgi:hypothetical protein